MGETSKDPGARVADRGLGAFAERDLGFAHGASGVGPLHLKNSLPPGVEARLADEVGGLIAALTEFGSRTKLISEGFPDGSDPRQAIPLFLSLCSFQIAVALGEAMNCGVFVDDSREYLRKLDLSCGDLFRQLDLDGRRFLAVALVHESANKRVRVSEARDER